MAERHRENFVVDSQLLNNRSSPVVVVVAGKIGSGKSTVLNNLYGLNLEVRSSPTSVMRTITERVVQRNGATVRVLDTPGLGGVSVRTEVVAKQIASAVRGSDYTLLYCLPVKPSDTLTETDNVIIKNLQLHLGSKVWDKCVLLLTFSDVLQREFTADHQANEYITFLRGHVQAFHRILKECGADVPRISSTFDYDRMQTEIGEIVAVPVMKNRSVTILNAGMNWIDQALSEISKASQLTRRKDEEPPMIKKIFRALCPNIRNPTRAVVCALVGAGVGGLYGWYYHGCTGMFICSCMAFILLNFFGR